MPEPQTDDDADVVDGMAEIAVLPSSATVALRIRDDITGGRLPLGARINDRELAAELGISRTPVREALLRLQNEGLVEIRPQSGTFVFDPDAEQIRELCATRSILETGAIRLLLEAGSDEVFTRLNRLVGRAALALDDGDLAACDALDWQFHEAIVAATGNRYLENAYRGISSQLRALRQRMPRNAERIARAIVQHRRIVDLCADGRGGDAVAEIAAHVGHVERLLAAVADH